MVAFYLSSILEIISYIRSDKDPCMFMKIIDNELINVLECYVIAFLKPELN